MEKKKKPVCKLKSTDGNVFSIIAKVRLTLKRAGMKEEAEEFSKEAFNCNCYDDVLVLVHKYITAE